MGLGFPLDEFSEAWQKGIPEIPTGGFNVDPADFPELSPDERTSE